MRKTVADKPHTASIPWREIQDRIERAEKLVVITHIDPDGDAIGTQLAFGEYLRSLGKHADLVCDSELPSKYRFLPAADLVVRVPETAGRNGYDLAVILECPNRARMGAAADLLVDGLPVINIDHHPDNTLRAEVDWIDTSTSSVGEMTYEYFLAVGFEITPGVATQLYTAILTDTGRFRFESTGPRTLAVAGELVARGADPRTICDRVYFEMEPATLALTVRVLSSLEYYEDGRICLMTLKRSMKEETGAPDGATEGLVDFSLMTRGVMIGVLLKEVDGELTKVSLRSRDGYNVSEVAARLHGGGHANAAGGRLEMGLDRAKPEILRILREAL